MDDIDSTEAEMPLIAPAPWQLTAECFIFAGHSWNSTLPAGACDPREAAALLRDTKPHRALYSVILFRYSESPVGPYDELMFIPGFYNVNASIKDKPKTVSRLRITRIYVSTEASIYNGRKNWNIPKHKADFRFEELSAGRVHIKVTVPGEIVPFFEVQILKSQRLPSFPFKWSWLPLDCSLLQPPLPKLSGVLHGEMTNDEEVADQPWKQVEFTLDMPKSRIAYIYPKLATANMKNRMAYANGINYPDIAPWTAGLYCPVATVQFGEPTHVTVV